MLAAAKTTSACQSAIAAASRSTRMSCVAIANGSATDVLLVTPRRATDRTNCARRRIDERKQRGLFAYRGHAKENASTQTPYAECKARAGSRDWTRRGVLESRGICLRPRRWRKQVSASAVMGQQR